MACQIPPNIAARKFLEGSVSEAAPAKAKSRGAYLNSCRVLDLTPSRLARVNQLELNRRNSEQCDHRRLLLIPLHAIVMRGASNAADEAASRNGKSITRIEVRAAVHPPRAGQNQRQPIGGVCMGSAHKAGIPFH